MSALEHKAKDWQIYRMNMHKPHEILEPVGVGAVVQPAVTSIATRAIILISVFISLLLVCRRPPSTSAQNAT